ncbi:hypothetical protein DER45DRAFT_550661, partial [Fusarium avenaceum]
MFGYWSSRKRRDLTHSDHSVARWIIDCLEIGHVIADPRPARLLTELSWLPNWVTKEKRLGFLGPDSVDLGSGLSKFCIFHAGTDPQSCHTINPSSIDQQHKSLIPRCLQHQRTLVTNNIFAHVHISRAITTKSHLLVLYVSSISLPASPSPDPQSPQPFSPEAHHVIPVVSAKPPQDPAVACRRITSYQLSSPPANYLSSFAAPAAL